MRIYKGNEWSTVVEAVRVLVEAVRMPNEVASPSRGCAILNRFIGLTCGVLTSDAISISSK